MFIWLPNNFRPGNSLDTIFDTNKEQTYLVTYLFLNLFWVNHYRDNLTFTRGAGVTPAPYPDEGLMSFEMTHERVLFYFYRPRIPRI